MTSYIFFTGELSEFIPQAFNVMVECLMDRLSYNHLSVYM